MKEYLCVLKYIGFTVGKIYYTDKHGFLIDDDGDRRIIWAPFDRLFEVSVSTIMENE